MRFRLYAVGLLFLVIAIIGVKLSQIYANNLYACG